MRKVKIALRTDGNSKKSLNSGASILMDALFTNEQLANMSICGNKCPSIPDAKPKPAIDKDILNEMISMMRLDPFYFMLTTSILNQFTFYVFLLGFFIKFWDDTNKGVILTEQQVRDAVTAN